MALWWSKSSFCLEEKSRDLYHYNGVKRKTCLFPNCAESKIAETLQSQYGYHNSEFTRSNPPNLMCDDKRGEVSKVSWLSMHQISSKNTMQIPASGSFKYSWFCVVWNGSLAESISKQTYKMHNVLPFWQIFG